MRLKRALIRTAAIAGVAAFGWAATAQTTTTWNDVSSIFSDNCTRCHGTNGRAGLNLTTYATAIAGSSNRVVLIANDPSNSRLVQRIQGEITPRMPRGAAALSADDIATIVAWINDGLME